MSKRNPTYKDMLRIARQRIKAKDYMGAHEAITASGANMIDIQEFFTKAEMKAMARWANQRVGATPKRKKKNPDYKAKRGMVEAIISVNGYYDRPGSKVVRRITGSTFLSAAHAARAWIEDKVAGRMYYVVLVDDQGSPIDHMQTYGSKYRRNPKTKRNIWKAYHRPAHDYLDDDEVDALPVKGDKVLAKKLLHWHYGQSDPIYSVGSSWLAGRSVPMSIAESALSNLQKEDSFLMDRQDAKELREVIRGLQFHMQRTFQEA